MPYPILYADPAWSYNDKGHAGRRGSGYKYPTLSLAQIKAMPVAELADPAGSALFLWVTYPLLEEGIATLKAWGFQYKTVAFTWVKLTTTGKPFFGMGHWTRTNPEICLLGLRGKIKRQSASVRNLVMSTRGRHSEKPAEVRDHIVQLMGDKPRLELFARHSTPGWHVWGNEVESNVTIPIS